MGEHHEKTVTVVKKVAVPYPVTKEVRVPVEKLIHVPIQVPVPQPYPVEKKVCILLQSKSHKQITFFKEYSKHTSFH